MQDNNDHLYDELAILFARRAQMPPRELYATNAADMFDTAIAKQIVKAAKRCSERFTPDSFDRRPFDIDCVRDMAMEAHLRMKETPDDGARQVLFAPIIDALHAERVLADPENVVVLAQEILKSVAYFNRLPPQPDIQPH
jgi:hypothetical protein